MLRCGWNRSCGGSGSRRSRGSCFLSERRKTRQAVAHAEAAQQKTTPNQPTLHRRQSCEKIDRRPDRARPECVGPSRCRWRRERTEQRNQLFVEMQQIGRSRLISRKYHDVSRDAWDDRLDSTPLRSPHSTTQLRVRCDEGYSKIVSRHPNLNGTENVSKQGHPSRVWDSIPRFSLSSLAERAGDWLPFLARH